MFIRINAFKNDINIPPDLFSDGYRFVLFDVTSLFTNIPLRKTVDVIVKCIYTDKQIQTGLQKRALKKLIIDSCTKTPFFFNGQLYQQIDGVSMRSPNSCRHHNDST